MRFTAVQRAVNISSLFLNCHESEEIKTLKKNTRQAWLSLILRTRESTPQLKKRIEANNIYLCELHFKPECFNICKYVCIFCFCIKSFEDVKDLLQFVENSNICKGLPQDEESKSVVADPTWDDEVTEFSQSTVFCHSVPKLRCESHFKTSVTFRSPNCIVLDCTTQVTTEKEQCKPCSKAHKLLKKVATRKMTVSSVRAKSEASLSACGPDKLRATVKATRLECKQLEDRVKELETRINEDGVSTSETVEKDILKIMGGQNLEATPHMKFFWQQQMKLLQTEKMARRSPPNYTLCTVPSW